MEVIEAALSAPVVWLMRSTFGVTLSPPSAVQPTELAMTLNGTCQRA